jgi:hypothetical protein
VEEGRRLQRCSSAQPTVLVGDLWACLFRCSDCLRTKSIAECRYDGDDTRQCNKTGYMVTV